VCSCTRHDGRRYHTDIAVQLSQIYQDQCYCVGRPAGGVQVSTLVFAFWERSTLWSRMLGISGADESSFTDGRSISTNNEERIPSC